MDFSDFYDIAEYGNKRWKGAYSPREVALNASDYYSDYQSCKDSQKLTPLLKELAKRLADDGSEKARYFLFMLVSSLNLIDENFTDYLKTDEWLDEFL